MKVQIHDDGKEKHQSFEAIINERDSIIRLIGYGENKDEAINKLKESVNDKIKELQNIDWNNFDWITLDCKII